MINKLIKPIIILLIICFGFLYGVGVGTYKIFPYNQIKKMKQIFTNDERIQSNYHETLTEKLEVIESEDIDLINLRKKLIKFIKPESEIEVFFKDENNRIKISTKYYGILSNAVLNRDYSLKNNCLLIYIQGHGGNPFDYDYHNEILNKFSDDGCDVLSMSMLGLGLNRGLASFPSRFGKVSLEPNLEENHGNYSFFYDEKNPNLDPLSLFLYPHMKIIESSIQKFDYKDVSIVGISGGGWYVTWLSALMPQIKKSIIYAGGIPFAFRKYGSMHGDWESTYSNLYNYVNYYNLFQMMLIDDAIDEKRLAFMIFNDRDPCCFSNPYALAFKNLINDNPKFPKIMIDENDKHSMNPSLVFSILRKE